MNEIYIKETNIQTFLNTTPKGKCPHFQNCRQMGCCIIFVDEHKLMYSFTVVSREYDLFYMHAIILY